ncbi:MAG: DUF1508 domain-containing protein [Candidatus Bathyarchaeia archaeon]
MASSEGYKSKEGRRNGILPVGANALRVLSR